MHPAYGAPAKQTASTRLRQYNVEPPGLPLEITSAQAQCHSHATVTPVADITKQTSICPDSDDVPHSVQPCWRTNGAPPQPHLSSNQRTFITIPAPPLLWNWHKIMGFGLDRNIVHIQIYSLCVNLVGICYVIILLCPIRTFSYFFTSSRSLLNRFQTWPRYDQSVMK